MARLSWTHEAAASLRAIHDHIARDRPVTAFRTMESVINKVEALTFSADKGSPYPHAPEVSIRLLHYGRFKIAYRTAEPDRVIVLAVFHGLVFLPLT